jgi:multidrug efflux pump subunit AcrB
MISWFARNSVAANLLMLAIMGLGLWTLLTGRIPLEVFPDMPSRFLSVNVPYPGATPEEVEEEIAQLEAVLRAVRYKSVRREVAAIPKPIQKDRPLEP